MNEFLRQLADRLRTYDSEIITADETADWPEGKLAELVSEGILSEIQPSTSVVCDQCEENCPVEPDIRTIPNTGRAVGVFVCKRDPDIGRIEINLDRLRRWQVNKKTLWKLVFGFDSEWQVPWDDSNGEYIPLQEAVNLANDDSITVRKMSRLLEDPDFPVHRMHTGRRCKVHMDEFRKWLKFAQHGQITDKAIEKYLKGVRERREQARRKRQSRGKSQ